MTDLSIKTKLLDSCNQYVEQRIATASQALNDAQDAANEENKSSVGDKYETGRAMMQLERDKAALQLAEALKLKRTLSEIAGNKKHDVVSIGSVVTTTSFKAFLAVGPGKVNIEGEEFFIVTPLSPLGKVLLGLKINQPFTFHNRPGTVLHIF